MEIDYSNINRWFSTHCIGNVHRDCDNCPIGTIAGNLPNPVRYDGEDSGVDCYATICRAISKNIG